ncbi:MAG: hypothetical protein IPJ34_16955 [Myxococcales bacterium]|nr:hypothetical protein [Myxococcales bacterium]
MSQRLSVLALTVLAACKEDPKPTPPPPPPGPVVVASGSGSTAGKSLCDPAAVGIVDAKVAALLPDLVEGHCVLKTAPAKSFGEGTPTKIENVSDIIDGAGQVYSGNYYAKRYDQLKYVDGKGTGAEVEIVLTTFDKPENAYALFTYRVVANADPDPEVAKSKDRRPWQVVKGGGAAALGSAALVLWKGNYLVELSYSPDATKDKAAAMKAADDLLPKLATAIGDKLPGTTDLPADVKALPSAAEGAIALGVDYVPPKFARPEGKAEALVLNVAGGYAAACMKEGKKRFRVLAFVREEKDAARDIVETFRKLPGSVTLKDKEIGDDAVHFSFAVGQGGAGAAGKAEGVAVRRGAVVLAVIDEELVLGDPAKKEDWPRTTKDEKVEKLKKLFAARAAAPAPAPAASGSVTGGASAPAPSASAPK